MARYRKKPVVIEAVIFASSEKNHVYKWATTIQMDVELGTNENREPILKIPTLEGEMICSIGDYLIKEPFPTDRRKLYPCKPDIFEMTYEEV